MFLRGFALSDDLKTFSSAAMKEELGQDEDEEILGAEEAKQFRSLAATLNYVGLDRGDMHCAANEVCRKLRIRHGEAGNASRKLGEIEWSPKGYVDDAGMEERRRCERRRVGDWSRKKIDERWGEDDDDRVLRMTVCLRPCRDCWRCLAVA